MGFFSKKNADDNNPYYLGNNCFNFSNLYEEFSLRILNSINIQGYSNLYECYLCYCYGDSINIIDSEELCYRLVVGIDKERMINDSKYTRFVFDRIINGKNLRKINNFSYSFIEESKDINYIGSVLDINNNLVFYDDDNIRNIIKFSSLNDGLNSLYSMNDSDKKNRALLSSINRQARIDSLKAEKNKLLSSDYEYLNSKSK